jgi:glycosyltransferase involved in cell wall biosynthesis
VKLLQVLPSMDARRGGTAEAVRQLGLQLGKMGCNVDVVTLDDPQQPFVLGYPLNAFALGPSRGVYSYNRKLVPWLKANVGQYDAVIVNGLWQYHSFAVWQVLRRGDIPYYVFPHGMLDPWFRRTYPLKHLKKWLYWPWAEYRVLRDARRVLFTSDEERRLARQSFWLYRANERIVALGINPPPANADYLKEQFLAAHPRLHGQRILLFMSRIHEKKGCDLLIQAFAKLAHRDPVLHLVVAGPDQSGLVAKLKNLAKDLGVMDRVSWLGMLQGDMKWGAFYSAQAFVLPSHQENFGISVAEAMSCGLPVLISDKVNIWREIEMDGAGFVASDSLEGTVKNLGAWFDLDVQKRIDMAIHATMSFQRRFTAEAMAKSLLRVLEDSA